MDKTIWPPKIRYKRPSHNNKDIWDLKPEEEVRIYEIEDFLRIRLLEGKAEVFGRELPINETVFFYKG